MIPKRSFLRLMKEDLKRRNWLAAVSILTLFVAFPARLLLQLDYAFSLLEQKQIEAEAVRRLYQDLVSFGSGLVASGSAWFENTQYPGIFLVFILSALAMLCGLSGFSYIHSKEKLDFYHSLPVKKKNWFWMQYLSGIFIVAVPYMICLLICLLIGNAYGVGKPGDLETALEAYVLHMLYYLVSYGIAVLSAVISGRLVISAILFPVLMFLGPVYMILIQGLASSFFSTYGGMSLWTGEWWKFLSPLGLCYETEQEMAACQTGGAFPGGHVLLIFCLMAGMLVADRILFCIRKTEAAGDALAFPKLEMPLKVLVTVPASIWIGLTASNMTRTKTDFWFFGGIVFCVIMFGSLVEFIYHTDIREVAKPMQTGLILAVSLIAASAFRFDWFRYDAYLPGEDEIASMAVYQAGLDSRGRYVDGRVQWLNDTKEILRQTAAEKFDPIYQMAENGVEKAMQNDTDGAAIQVMYQLKNGRQVFRNYKIQPEVYKTQENRLFADSDYVENLYALYQVPEEAYDSLELSTLYGYSGTVHMSVSQRRALMAAYKQELRTVDYDQITGEDLQAQISFYCSSGEYYSADDNYPVLKSFKKTIAVLEEMGLEIPQKLNADDISSVEVYGLVKSTAYENEDGSSYVEETTSGNKLFTDKEDIRSIVEALHYADSTFASYGQFIGGYDSDYYSIYVSYKNYSRQFVSFYAKKEDVPECVVKAFE